LRDHSSEEQVARNVPRQKFRLIYEKLHVFSFLISDLT